MGNITKAIIHCFGGGRVKKFKSSKYLLSIIGVVLLIILVKCSPFKGTHDGFSKVLYDQAESQVAYSEKVTDVLASGAEGEGKLVGEHQVKGANWSIPNILRHLVMGDN